MGDIYAGCTVARLLSPKLASSMGFFEFAPKPPLPSFATLARYRKLLAPEVQLALVAPKSSWLGPRGALRPGAELDAGLAWLKRASDILKAGAIVIATGAELSTGERDRQLLAEFTRALGAATGRLLVIAPRGLWEAEHGAAFARQTGTVYGFDPLEDDAPPGPILYARVHPMGARPRLTDGHLAQIGERVRAAQSERAFVSIESEESLRDARRLAKLLAELDASGPADEPDQLGEEEDDGAAFDAEHETQPSDD
jgi:hypothetical protein